MAGGDESRSKPECALFSARYASRILSLFPICKRTENTMATTVTAAPAGTLINYRAEGGIAWIEMNDPPANTYTYEMMQHLDHAILTARMDSSVHVIILRGAGEKFFSAGANIKMLSSVTPEFKYYFCLHANETLNRLEQTP